MKMLKRQCQLCEASAEVGSYHLLYLLYPIVFSLPRLSVHGTWLLLQEATLTYFAISSMLWLSKQKKGTAHLVVGPGRCQGPTPTWEGALWLGMCLLLVCTQRTAGAPLEMLARALQSMLGGVARAAGLLCPSCQAPPTCHNINTAAGVDQALSVV